MENETLFERYARLQAYVAWTTADADCVAQVAPCLRPHIPALVEDFYSALERESEAHRVITGGRAQIERLKGTLDGWLEDLLSGQYDRDYVDRRWRVGLRHVEIGLEQVYTAVALARLRTGLISALNGVEGLTQAQLLAAVSALDKVLDLDLAIIQDAYHSELLLRQRGAERFATIGRVAGGVAHELRNPLNVVKTSVYFMLHARNPTPAKMAEHLNRIDRQVSVADRVITALSNFAKLAAPNLQPTALEEMLKGVVEVLEIPERIKLVWDIPPGTPAVMADSQQLEIVLSNLMRNAVEAMETTGTLTLGAKFEAGQVEIRVSDTGAGMSAEQLGRILEPLYSTKPRGIGLGLAISRAILAKHQAALDIDSAPGKGTSIAIRLAAATPDLLHVPPGES